MINTRDVEIVIRNREIAVRNIASQEILGFLNPQKLMDLINPEVALPAPVAAAPQAGDPSKIKQVEAIDLPPIDFGKMSLPAGTRRATYSNKYVAIMIEKLPYQYDMKLYDKSIKCNLPYSQYITVFRRVSKDMLKLSSFNTFFTEYACRMDMVAEPLVLYHVRGDGSNCLGYDGEVTKEFHIKDFERICNYILRLFYDRVSAGLIAYHEKNVDIYREGNGEITTENIIKFSREVHQHWNKNYVSFNLKGRTYEQLMNDLVEGKYTPHWRRS